MYVVSFPEKNGISLNYKTEAILNLQVFPVVWCKRKDGISFWYVPK